MTGKEIIEKLIELEYTVDVLGDECLESYIEGIGNIEVVESYGGEDMGSTYYVVYHFVDHNVYLRVDGWYQSHYGTEFGDWSDAVSEVKPVTKTITVFE